ncbi:MAG TPA: radical SAM protein, partial [Polyangium sp.]|nr:radical SAM protein [Polyangium sp.]
TFGTGAPVSVTAAPRRLPVVPAAETNFADFQNEALLGETKALQHEAAAHEKRNWVRLSYDCNNHCTFCLDSNAHDGTMRGTQDIKVQIVEGRKRGANRLILSGGEPTMHPNFLDFVKLGKLAGYPKIQTVTNGRMFRYPDFLNRAADNGLHEITFSLHGHTAKLHDALVGTPGAFVEEVAGLRAAVDSGRFIVNVDIVINKQNVKHLPEMLETFIGWGVKEFDLLHIIPFGNAWSDARHHLFYDLDGNLEFLQKAFAYARRPDVHIWLNRFPPPYAEGFEDLIQDPYKLNDEVRGRREEFDRYLSLGQKLSCREPERCRYCYLQSLCDTLDDVLDVRRAEQVDVIRYAGSPPLSGKLPEAPVARLVAPNVDGAREMARQIPQATLELELDSYTGLAEALDAEGKFAGKRVVAGYTGDGETAKMLLGLNLGFEVRVFLTKTTETMIREWGEPPAHLVLVQKNYDLVSDAQANDVDTKSFFRTYPHAPSVENVPACIVGRPVRKTPKLLDTEMLGADARVDMTAYTKRYVADGFYTKALRCKDCRENATCRGVHVNWVRAHGFGAVEPITE